VAGHWFRKNKSQDRPCWQDAVSFDEIAQLEDEKRRAVENEEMRHRVAVKIKAIAAIVSPTKNSYSYSNLQKERNAKTY
jgi:hypothetical protein